MEQVLRDMQKDIDNHCKNIDELNRDILKHLEKTNQDVIENLAKIVDEITTPVNVLIQTIVPKVFNPFKD